MPCDRNVYAIFKEMWRSGGLKKLKFSGLAGAAHSPYRPSSFTWAILDRLNAPLVRHTAQLDCRIDSEPFVSAAASSLA